MNWPNTFLDGLQFTYKQKVNYTDTFHTPLYIAVKCFWILYHIFQSTLKCCESIRECSVCAQYVCVCAISQHGQKGFNTITAFYLLLKGLGNQLIFLRMKYVKKISTMTFGECRFSWKIAAILMCFSTSFFEFALTKGSHQDQS